MITPIPRYDITAPSGVNERPCPNGIWVKWDDHCAVTRGVLGRAIVPPSKPTFEEVRNGVIANFNRVLSAYLPFRDAAWEGGQLYMNTMFKVDDFEGTSELSAHADRSITITSAHSEFRLRVFGSAYTNGPDAFYITTEPCGTVTPEKAIAEMVRFIQDGITKATASEKPKSPMTLADLDRHMLATWGPVYRTWLRGRDRHWYGDVTVAQATIFEMNHYLKDDGTEAWISKSFRISGAYTPMDNFVFMVNVELSKGVQVRCGVLKPDGELADEHACTASAAVCMLNDYLKKIKP